MPDSKEIETAILIADLSGYTALTEAHGSRSAADIVTRYAQILEESLQPDTQLVERVGDEVLAIGRTPGGVIRTAIKMQKIIAQEPNFPTVHAGIHAGSLLEQGGRFYGSALNLASRVAAHARGGQILCTADVTKVSEDLNDVAFRPLGLVRFKNVIKPVGIFEIGRKDEEAEGRIIDPVCRMQVRLDTAPARLPFKENTYYFCSFECAKAFAENPDFYCSA